LFFIYRIPALYLQILKTSYKRWTTVRVLLRKFYRFIFVIFVQFPPEIDKTVQNLFKELTKKFVDVEIANLKRIIKQGD